MHNALLQIRLQTNPKRLKLALVSLATYQTDFQVGPCKSDIHRVLIYFKKNIKPIMNTNYELKIFRSLLQITSHKLTATISAHSKLQAMTTALTSRVADVTRFKHASGVVGVVADMHSAETARGRWFPGQNALRGQKCTIRAVLRRQPIFEQNAARIRTCRKEFGRLHLLLLYCNAVTAACLRSGTLRSSVAPSTMKTDRDQQLPLRTALFPRLMTAMMIQY